MVRHAKISLDCPAPPAYALSILDDEFQELDAWPELDRSPSQPKSATRSTKSPRNLAGVIPEKNVPVKSRRPARGRLAHPVRAASTARMRQVTVSLPFDQWRLLREEAVRQKIPMSELCRRWFGPHFARLDAQHDDKGD